jgi:hypothetical protein
VCKVWKEDPDGRLTSASLEAGPSVDTVKGVVPAGDGAHLEAGSSAADLLASSESRSRSAAEVDGRSGRGSGCVWDADGAGLGVAFVALRKREEGKRAGQFGRRA